MGNGTSIGKVRGLGSSHHGAHHWLLQRYTAVGNLVLMVWLAVSFILLPDFSYEAVTEYFKKPLPAVGLGLLVISLFWHARLGLQVVIEDYIHTPGNKFAVFALLNLLTFGGAAFGLVCAIRLALTGAA